MKLKSVFSTLTLFVLLLLGGCAPADLPEKQPDDVSALTKIVFSYSTLGNNGFDTHIVSIYPDGTEKHRIMTDASDSHMPLFSPDGKKIAFLAQKDGETELYLADSDGSNARRITSGIDSDADNFVHFLWHPDSKHILLDVNHAWQILDILTKEILPYSDWESSPSFYPVAYSHDGSRLLYLSSSQIRVQDTDGSNDYVLVENSWQKTSPAWSPDDQQIIFVAVKDIQEDLKGSLYIVNLDGSGLKEITDQEFPVPIDFAWAPDGKNIVFYATPSFAKFNLENGEITELFDTEYPDYITSITWQP